MREYHQPTIEKKPGLKTRKLTPKQLDRYVGLAALLLILTAWFIGKGVSGTETKSKVLTLAPANAYVHRQDSSTYAVYASENQEELLHYIVLVEAGGYGGPMHIATAVDHEGKVLDLRVVDHRESYSWYQKVAESDFISGLKEKDFKEKYTIGEDVDGVTGATYTSSAIAKAAGIGTRLVAQKQLGKDIQVQKEETAKFGVLEIVLILLFIVSYFGRKTKSKVFKTLRWTSLLSGLVILGFWFTMPLTLAHFNQMIIGFWPDWETHLFWYILLGGVFLIMILSNKNIYCDWICPFGAAQECIGLIGGAKNRRTETFDRAFKWVHRIVVLVAIVVALLFQNPGLTSYEVFGALFDLTGNTVQFLLLGLVLFASLYIKQPWCKYICPIRSIGGYVRMLRSWGKELWTKRNRRNVVFRAL